jgi:hypothetical protein
MHGQVQIQQRKTAKAHVQVNTCDGQQVSPCATLLLDGLLYRCRGALSTVIVAAEC